MPPGQVGLSTIPGVGIGAGAGGGLVTNMGVAAAIKGNIMGGVATEATAAVYVPSPQDKLTTVFIGSIAEGVTDAWMERFLKACGGVRNWKRVTDAQGKPKGFGFCVYDSAASVLVCLRALGGEAAASPSSSSSTTAPTSASKGLVLQSASGLSAKPLLVKVDAVARKHVDEFVSVGGEDVEGRVERAIKEVKALADAMKGAEADSFLEGIIGGGGVGAAVGDDKLVPSTSPSTAATSSAFSTSTGISSQQSTASGGLAGLSGPTTSISTDETHPSQTQTHQQPAINPNKELAADMPAEEREKVVKEISMFRERIAAKEREKREREAEIAAEERRGRRGGGDVGRGGGSEEDLREAGRRGSGVSGGDGRHVRRGSIFGDEEEEDEELRRKERRERDMQQAYLDRESRYERVETQRIRVVQSARKKDEERDAKRARERHALERLLYEWDDDLEMEEGREEFYRDRDRWLSKRHAFLQRERELDDRDRAQEEEEIAREIAREREEDRIRNPQRHAQERELEEQRRKEEEERLRAERLLREVERERAERAREQYQATTVSGVVVGRIMTVEERKEAIGKLVAGIPADREGLCRWDVKWDFLHEYVISNKIRPFVVKKVVEYLGEEETDLVQFTMDLIKRRTPAAKVIDELQGALDDEAEIFVMKLWRMVIFESESRAQGLA